MKTKVLVVGCGSIGLRHLQNLLLNNSLELAGLDLSPRAENEVKEISSEIIYFNDFDSAAKWQPDLVIVATPNHLHKDNCLWAFDIGAHVLCEKPLATTVAEGREIVNAAEKTGKKLGVGFTERFRESIDFIIKEATSGNLGKLIGGRAMVGTYNTMLCAKDPKHRAETFGSLILDYVHELDILAAIFGKTKRVECMCNTLADKELKANPSLAAAIAEYEKGEIVSIHFDYVQHPQRRFFEIYGDKKTLVYDFQTDTLEIYDCEQQGHQVRTFYNVRNEQFVAEHNDMLNAINADIEPRVPGIDGLKSLEVSEMILEKLTK
jgi:UDP-N-acetylglucosamine 3-dehydrogenase